jgi:hypothetical protein
MRSTDDSLHNQLEALLSGAEPPDVSSQHFLDAARQRSRRRTVRRRRTSLFGAAIVVMASAWMVVAVSNADNGEVVLSTETPSDSLGNLDSDLILEGPLGVRDGPALLALPDGVMIWGGTDPQYRELQDGSVYRIPSNRWEKMSKSVLPATTQADECAGSQRSCRYPSIVLHGGGVVIARGRSAASWDPDSNQWDRLPNAPAPIQALVSDGTRLLAFGSISAELTDGAAAWRPIGADATEHLVDMQAVWSGGQVIVVGHPFGAQGVVGFAIDPSRDSGAWNALPSTDLIANGLHVGGDGSRLVAIDSAATSRAFDPKLGEWTELVGLSASGEGQVVSLSNRVVAIVDSHLWELVGDNWQRFGQWPYQPGPVTGAGEALASFPNSGQLHNELILVPLP